MVRISEAEGHGLFGGDPRGYDAVRPRYPEASFSLMQQTGALYPGARTLEIGAGTGIATRRLLALGAKPLVVIEPDVRLHAGLSQLAVTLLPGSFEETDLAGRTFDLVVAAMAFHWLDPSTRVQRIATALEPGGSVVLLWNVFSDPTKPDPFHLATTRLLEHLAVSPSETPGGLPFALDKQARVDEFLNHGGFELSAYLEVHSSLKLNTAQMRTLYASFASIARLPAADRAKVLDKLSHVAEREFGGAVERNVTSVIYLFRRFGAAGTSDSSVA